MKAASFVSIVNNKTDKKDQASKQPMATVAPRPAKGLEKETAQRLIVVLERASLETVKAGQSFQLLNSDDHAHILKKNNKNAAECVAPLSGAAFV